MEPSAKCTCPVCKAVCSIETLVPLYIRSEIGKDEDKYMIRKSSSLRHRGKDAHKYSLSYSTGTRLSIDIPPRPRSPFVGSVDLTTHSHNSESAQVSGSSTLSASSSSLIAYDQLEDESTIDFLSRVFLLLGIFVVFCLLIF